MSEKIAEFVASDEGLSPLHVRQADSFWLRFRGLMGQRRLAEDEGLLLSPCNSVHMCFMRFVIDVVYLIPEGDDYRIVKVVPHLRPWIGFSACFKAKCTLELAAGTAKKYGLNAGDILKVVHQVR